MLYSAGRLFWEFSCICQPLFRLLVVVRFLASYQVYAGTYSYLAGQPSLFSQCVYFTLACEQFLACVFALFILRVQWLLYTCLRSHVTITDYFKYVLDTIYICI